MRRRRSQARLKSSHATLMRIGTSIFVSFSETDTESSIKQLAHESRNTLTQHQHMTHINRDRGTPHDRAPSRVQNREMELAYLSIMFPPRDSLRPSEAQSNWSVRHSPGMPNNHVESGHPHLPSAVATTLLSCSMEMRAARAARRIRPVLRGRWRGAPGYRPRPSRRRSIRSRACPRSSCGWPGTGSPQTP